MARLRLKSGTELAMNPSNGRFVPIRGAKTVKTVSAQFLADLQADWEEHGNEVLAAVREQFPEIYFQMMIKLAQVTRIEVGGAGDFDRAKTQEEILQRVEERAGLEGRKHLERFMRGLEKIEQQQTIEAEEVS
jgi:hypothetical protein